MNKENITDTRFSSGDGQTDNTGTIHEFDFNMICEFFSLVERQGPGSPWATLKALGFIDNLTEESLIADIGCGTGGQTMVLGANAPGHITGLDLFPGFIDIFNRNAEQLGLADRVKGIVRSMEELPFRDGELDLIWSEGAIYNVGFERGLNQWRRYLKTGGYIAVTDATWFTNARPAEIEDYWMKHYPEIDTIPAKVAQVQEAGYIPVATFVLPSSCWTELYFKPLVRAREIFLEKYAGNRSVEEFVSLQHHEAEMYREYGEYYGYVFYIGKKIW